MLAQDSNLVFDCEINIGPVMNLHKILLSRNKENQFGVQDWIKVGKFKCVIAQPEFDYIKKRLIFRAYFGIVKSPKEDPNPVTRAYFKVTCCAMEINGDPTDPLETFQVKVTPSTTFNFGNAALEYSVTSEEEAVGEEEAPIAVMEVDSNTYLNQQLNIKINFDYYFDMM